MATTENQSASESQNLNDRSADTPLTNPKIDRLGYAPFAQHLADSICQMTFPQGFAIAIYGTWGSGKSTLLNFIIHYLKQKPENERPIIAPFNAWLFSGQEDINKRFFDQLETVLSEWKSVPTGLRSRIADLANVVAEIPLPYAQAGGAVAKLFDNQQKETSDLQEEVEDTLQQRHPRIVVTIDDIDQLTADEIRQLFRVVAAVPDFTNVVYLLVFNREVVIKALTQTSAITGEAELERIIQVGFDLPVPNHTSLRRLLFDKLNAIFADTPKQLFDQMLWGNIYFQGIDHFITHLQDIVRLTNNLSVTYPVVKGEVNAVDFVAIESLRVFCPIVYDTIRKNPQAFVGGVDTKNYFTSTIEEFKQFHNSWLAQLQAEDKQPVKRLISNLFPKLKTVWDNTYDAAQEATWHKQRCVCNLEIFPIYFRLVLPEDELSQAQVKAILALANDAEVFGETLVELAEQKRADGTTQVRAFLEWLEDYTKEIPGDCIASIVQALFNVGDRLLLAEDEPQGMFDFGNDGMIHRIIWQLLLRLQQSTRFEVLKAAIVKGNALSIIVQELVAYRQQQGKSQFVSEQQLQELENIAVRKVQAAAQQNSLLQTPALLQILHSWQEWASEESVKQWLQTVISHDEGLLEFSQKFLQTTITQSGSDMIPKKVYSLDYKQMELYLDPALIIYRIRGLEDKNELTEKQKIVVQQFIQEYDIK